MADLSAEPVQRRWWRGLTRISKRFNHMSQAAIRRDASYTYADYLLWSDDERWELIHGVAYNMTPAPGRRHQDISRELLTLFSVHLRGKKCKVYDAP